MRFEPIEITRAQYPFLWSLQRKSGLTLPEILDKFGDRLLVDIAVVGFVGYKLLANPADTAILVVGPVLIGAAAIWTLWGLWQAWREARGALALHLFHWGDSEAVARELEEDFAGRTASTRALQLGQRWLCYVRGGEALATPLASLLWAYGGEGRESTSGETAFAAMVSEPRIVLFTRRGSKFELPMSQADVTKGLADLTSAAPWLPVGYSRAMRDTWNADRAELIALVDRARQQDASFAAAAVGAGGAQLDPPTEAPGPPGRPLYIRILTVVGVAAAIIYALMNHPASS